MQRPDGKETFIVCLKWRVVKMELKFCSNRCEVEKVGRISITRLITMNGFSISRVPNIADPQYRVP